MPVRDDATGRTNGAPLVAGGTWCYARRERRRERSSTAARHQPRASRTRRYVSRGDRGASASRESGLEYRSRTGRYLCMQPRSAGASATARPRCRWTTRSRPPKCFRAGRARFLHAGLRVPQRTSARQGSLPPLRDLPSVRLVNSARVLGMNRMDRPSSRHIQIRYGLATSSGTWASPSRGAFRKFTSGVGRRLGARLQRDAIRPPARPREPRARASTVEFQHSSRRTSTCPAQRYGTGSLQREFRAAFADPGDSTDTSSRPDNRHHLRRRRTASLVEPVPKKLRRRVLLASEGAWRRGVVKGPDRRTP